MPRSLPALAAGILQSDKTWSVRSDAARVEQVPLVPAYHVDDDLPPHMQQQRAAYAILELARKLGRLGDAFGKWQVFEPGPYFNLYPAQARRLCRVEQTHRVVRVRVYGDLLVPAFRAAERQWVESFLPAYHAGWQHDRTMLTPSTPTSSALNANGHRGDAFYRHLIDEAMPRLAALLKKAEQAIQATLDMLFTEMEADVEVLAALGAVEERIAHRPPPGTTLAPGLPLALQRLPREMPTLTLDIVYPQSMVG